jgi:hypothetical protein
MEKMAGSGEVSMVLIIYETALKKVLPFLTFPGRFFKLKIDF